MVRAPNDPKWPALPLSEWHQTYATLQRWTQVVGKVRLKLTPLVNHWWNVALHLTARGLTTGPMPCGDFDCEIAFDFRRHELTIETSRGELRAIPLAPRSVADFYDEVMHALRSVGVSVRIWDMPVEIDNPVAFSRDTGHASYDREYVERFWHVILSAHRVLYAFRAEFIGKCSPVHFFWGSFDLAVTRFSGRRAPVKPDADPITREAYSHEVCSAGFWPGGESFGRFYGEPIFYCYMAPEPPRFREAHIAAPAFYHQQFGEWMLNYEDMRRSASPDQTLMEFLRDTYAAGADAANWNRHELENLQKERRYGTGLRAS